MKTFQQLFVMIVTFFKNVSSNYDEFHFLGGINRNVIPSHVTNMRKSVNFMGCIRAVIVANIDFIDGEMKKYIVDGQHLFKALQGLGLPIPYIEIEIKNKQQLIETMAFLNNSSKSWRPEDYVTAWALINDEYKKLKEIRKYTGLTYNSITMLAINNSDRRRMRKIINTGQFSIINENFDYLISEAGKLLDIVDQKPRARIPDRFVSAFLRYYNTREKYDPQEARRIVNENREIILTATANELEDELDKIFFDL